MKTQWKKQNTIDLGSRRMSKIHWDIISHILFADADFIHT